MNIDRIIGKVMGDVSIGDEKSALESWKKEAEENIKALADMRKISELSDSLKGYADFNEDEAWKAFEYTIVQKGNNAAVNPATAKTISHNVNTKETKIFSLGMLSKIAAIAVVVMGAIFLFNNQNDTLEFTVQDYAANTQSINVDLLDGTAVLLDKDTKLRSKDKRTVSMKGRAFFDVARDEEQQFKINLPIGEIIVLGTKFSVVADVSTTEIFVEEGSVAYHFQGTTHTLVAGEFIQAVNNNVERFVMNDDNYSSWKSKRLMFNDNTMSEVIDALSRHFGKQVKLNDPKLFKNCNVKATFNDSSLEEILNDFSTTHGLKYEVRDNIYIVSSSEC